jgi:hypothetical protein
MVEGFALGSVVGCVPEAWAMEGSVERGGVGDSTLKRRQMITHHHGHA